MPRLQISKPGVVLFKPYDERQLVFDGRLDHAGAATDLVSDGAPSVTGGLLTSFSGLMCW